MITNILPFRKKIGQVIFGVDTRAGRVFDVGLLVCILSSVLVILLSSVESLNTKYLSVFNLLEWFFTIAFSIEYILRIFTAKDRLKYVTSFFGIVDLLSILPNYVGLFYPRADNSGLLRLLRVLRVFQILKLGRYIKDANILTNSLFVARRKIFVFIATVMVLVVIFGGVMFVIEGPQNGYTSIPESIYWAIVTITTVGYGDVTPKTPLGQMVSSLAMLLGYAIIAIPTGIISSELMDQKRKHRLTKRCKKCGEKGHDIDASYCKFCGQDMGPGNNRTKS